MAIETVRQPSLSPVNLERTELAQSALCQVDALLPIAQSLAYGSGDSMDAMLGLLGRIRQMNDAAMEMLSEVMAGSEPTEDTVLV